MTVRQELERPPSTRLPRRALRAALVVLVAAACLAPPSAARRKAGPRKVTRMESQLDTARSYLDLGAYPEAGETARRILASGDAPDPVRARALTILGEVLFFNSRVRIAGRGRPSDEANRGKEARSRKEGMRLAEAALRDAVELGGPTRSEARLYLAEALYADGDTDQARRELDAYFQEIGPGSPHARAADLRSCLEFLYRSETVYSLTDSTEDGALKVEAGKKISATPPEYTLAARTAGVQGVVISRMIIDETGKVRCVEPLLGQPLGLTEATLDTLWKWTFEPARRNGKAVPIVFTETVNFRLE